MQKAVGTIGILHEIDDLSIATTSKLRRLFKSCTFLVLILYETFLATRVSKTMARPKLTSCTSTRDANSAVDERT